MASRLIRLKTRELLPAEPMDELEEMEYELDRQMLIQQMLEYRKFKEAANELGSIKDGAGESNACGRPKKATLFS